MHLMKHGIMNQKKVDSGRRDFVKSSATALAGGALLAGLPMNAFGMGPQKEIRGNQNWPCRLRW